MFRNASRGVIRVSDINPHYFEYKGREILLITSAEHYGAVSNNKFDYIPYFDKLAGYGLNYTRIYPGSHIEPAGIWLPEDNLAPGADVIVPWARSNVPGYIGGGNKFDLNAWDTAYFARLRDFITQAYARDIIVEICFFNAQTPDYWPYSPLHKDANIQGVGDCDHVAFETLDNAALAREQLRYILKIVEETNEFDNVIYEFVDEPTLMLTPSHKAYRWIESMFEAVVELEDRLPKKHMLTQQLEIGVDFCGDDRAAFIVTQYLALSSRQIGGIAALNNSYGYNKPIELNETAYVPSWYDREHTSIARLEAWEFMVGGGASFNQLNGYFIVSNPAGDHEINHRILAGLRNLRMFLEGFDYIKMTRDARTVRRVSIGASYNMISERGRQYAMYMHHSFTNAGGALGTYYEPEYGDYEPDVTLVLDKGGYTAAFIDPETLNVIKEIDIITEGGETVIACPRYKLDIALKIIAKGE